MFKLRDKFKLSVYAESAYDTLVDTANSFYNHSSENL